MIRAGHAVYFTALSVWVGGLTTLAFVVAPVVFRNAPSRSAAGTIFGAALRAFGYVEMAAAGLLVVSSAVLYAVGPREGWFEITRLGLVAIMVVLLFVTLLGVNPAIAAERERIPSFDALPDGDPAKGRFDRLHRWSVRLAGGNILLGFALLVLSAASVKGAR
jgi:uncharacterized membrane protein